MLNARLKHIGLCITVITVEKKNLCGKPTGKGKARSTRTIIVLRLAPRSLTGKLRSVSRRPPANNCDDKEQYGTYGEAQQSAQRYMRDILTYNEMQTYYCVLHHCYHIGHSNKKRKYRIVMNSPA